MKALICYAYLYNAGFYLGGISVNRYLSTLFMVLCGAISYAAQQADKSAEFQELYKKYNPTGDRCRAVIQSGEKGPIVNGSSLLKENKPEPLIACMMTGSKDVALVDYQRLSDTALAVAKEYNMGYIFIGAKSGSKSQLILYTPKGKQYALLFVKNKRLGTGLGGAYLTGHLLGYSDDDIRAFYERMGWKTFDVNKKASLEWISDNAKDIEQWIVDNMKKYDFALGDFTKRGIF